MSIVSRIKGLLGYGDGDAAAPSPLIGSFDEQWFQRGARAPAFSDATAILHACIAAYAETCASMDLELWRETPKGGYVEITDGATAAVLRRPNAYQTRSDFVLNLVWSLMQSGNAYALIERNRAAEPIALHLLESRSTMPYVNEQERAIFYAVGINPLIGDVDYMVPQRDILHVRLHCPRHPLVGVSPIIAAAMSMAANAAITSQQAAFFNRMARPSGVLSTESTLTRQQITQLREAWNEQSKGLNSGGVPILSSGLKWQALSIDSQDSQVAQAFNMTVEDVARAFRVPLPLVGSPIGATYNNVEQLIQLWLSSGLGFVLEHIESALDAALSVPLGEEVEFDTDVLQRTDFKGRIDALTKGISGGLYSPNEAREREGLPRVAFGDEPRVQAQVVPLSAVDKIPSATPAPSAPTKSAEQEARIAEVRAYLASLRGRSQLLKTTGNAPAWAESTLKD